MIFRKSIHSLELSPVHYALLYSFSILQTVPFDGSMLIFSLTFSIFSVSLLSISKDFIAHDHLLIFILRHVSGTCIQVTFEHFIIFTDLIRLLIHSRRLFIQKCSPICSGKTRRHATIKSAYLPNHPFLR